jgi:hypothetical protein
MAARTGERVRGGAQLPQPASLPIDGFSSFPRVKAFTGGLSRETIRLWEIAGRFPRHISPTQRTALLPNAELHRWASNPAAYRAAPETQDAA